ncbi:MAG: NERD domain-containing protein [Butyrivibrio sp.]|uniref:nuclease-related domain-containing protein n=1 Tax=Butyrivibrio sp. TaxID=28121 RepID=UPI001B78CAFB|nr:nuclease-related domain-containing protein [Butyrivibrio sp.]MBP3280726.1 NERD domain-containing protein [Butyrivibrio sp.]MBP3782105.1 NERD domain-containing protein [Butyrivibrio sp.]
MFKIFIALVIIGAAVTLISIISGFIFGGIGAVRVKRRGDEFEDMVASKFKKTFNADVVRNLIFYKIKTSYKELKKRPMEIGYEAMAKETEADMAFVCTKGIFCIECKSFKNRDIPLQGSLNQKVWTRQEYAGTYQMQNPFNQNYKHVMALKDHGFTNIYNIVITNSDFEFTYCGVKRKSLNKPYVGMLKNSTEKMALVRQWGFTNGLKLLKEDINSLPDVFTEKEVEQITEKLKTYEATRQERKVHALAKELLR